MLEFGLSLSSLSFPLGMIPLCKTIPQGGTICQLRDLILTRLPKLLAYLERDQGIVLNTEESDTDRKADIEEEAVNIYFPEERWRYADKRSDYLYRTADVFILGLFTFIGSSQLLADFNKLVSIFQINPIYRTSPSGRLPSRCTALRCLTWHRYALVWFKGACTQSDE